MASYKVVIISLTILLAFLGKSSANLTSNHYTDLTENHYSSSCPHFEGVVTGVIQSEFKKEPRMLASVLRLHFHDCFVNGCDGSILLSDTTRVKGEMNAGPNKNSIRGFEVIESIKTTLEKPWNCKGVVSCADILTLAARESVIQLGGPKWILEFGRKDGRVTTNSMADAQNDIPNPNMSISDLKKKFSALNFDNTDLVALAGAHTVGKAKCISFRERIYSNASLINRTFAATIKQSCPSKSGNKDNNLVPLDSWSPLQFDNSYYKDLVAKEGLLNSDQELNNRDRDTARLVNIYSNNQITFFDDFSRAMTKMSLLNLLTGKQGEIRKVCSRVN